MQDEAARLIDGFVGSDDPRVPIIMDQNQRTNQPTWLRISQSPCFQLGEILVVIRYCVCGNLMLYSLCKRQWGPWVSQVCQNYRP